MSTPRVKVGDEVRIPGPGNTWGNVAAVSDDGKYAQVLFQHRQRNRRGAFLVKKTWHPIGALWTREDEQEARKR